MADKNWFTVDREGLRALVAGRDSDFILFELLQNALDEPGVTTVKVEVGLLVNDDVTLSVEDDAPEGFADLRHAFTLFAHTRKRANAEQRGRFNLGEKLVLSLATSGDITTTKGTVMFGPEGRKESRGGARKTGSLVSLHFKKGIVNSGQILAAAQHVIVPPGITVLVNGKPLQPRAIVREFEVTLPTVLESSDYVMRRTERKTRVRLYDVAAGETASIYEMGLPIVETGGDRWHADVNQKIPLNQDRDNVSPAYLQRLRAAVLNETHTVITKDDANAQWVRDALEREDVKPEAVTAAVELRFGPKRVIFDPSDREANKLAVVEGYTVIPGGALSAASWRNVKSAGAALPAGKVTPSPSAYAKDGPAVKVIPRAEWTPGMKRVVEYAKFLGGRLLNINVSVRVVSTTNKFAACWGAEELDLNARRLGRAWFDSSLEAIDRLLLHEFAHHHESDHLSTGYHEAICALGAKLAKLARNDRRVFRKFEVPGDVDNAPDHTAREPLAVEEEARA